MILRALRVVGFRGLPEMRLADLPERGVMRVSLPDGAAPATVSDALRFLLLGDPAVVGDASAEGSRLAFVEATFRMVSGTEVSVFRGVDPRGNSQVSLREPVGPRVTDGHEAVARRLEELIGSTPDAWCAAALDVPLPGAVDPPDLRVSRRPALSAHRTHLQPMASAARNATQELRRSLRAERLRLLASRRHGELLDHGRRLRHERRSTALAVDRETADRDRARARLRAVNEYRDQLARGADDHGARDAVAEAPPSGVRGMSAAEVLLVCCAALSFTALAIYSTSATVDPDRRLLQIVLGVAFLVSVASYLHVAARGSPQPAPSARRDAEGADARARRDALRHRFADLGDPDDPQLPERLRARLVELDERLAPIQARLEALDDAIAVCDLELGRASRSLRESSPELGPGDVGLPSGMDVPAAVDRARALGDAVYAAVVERDALLSAGAVNPGAARQALAVALDALSDAREVPAGVAGLLRRVDAFTLSVTQDPAEDQIAELLESAIEQMERVDPDSPAPPERRQDAAAPSGLVVPETAAAARTDEELVTLLGPAAQVLVGEAADVASAPAPSRRPGFSHRAE